MWRFSADIFRPASCDPDVEAAHVMSECVQLLRGVAAHLDGEQQSQGDRPQSLSGCTTPHHGHHPFYPMATDHYQTFAKVRLWDYIHGNLLSVMCCHGVCYVTA